VSNKTDPKKRTIPDSKIVCQRAKKKFEKIAFFKMAPFKLKFRMGGLRSTSQENDNDPQNNYNENLTNTSQTNLFQFGSNTTIDSEVITGSTGSLNNDQRALLNNGDDGRIGNAFYLKKKTQI
jgi:hypothetical protein